MEKFTQLTGVAAPLPLVNVDTDMMVPARYLKTIERKGLGKILFYTMRYDADGKETPDFILNRAPYRNAKILITGDNFGCGSSREHAPWALLDFGIRCVIGPSFADIFFNNCFKNSILPIVLPKPQVEALAALAENPDTATFTVDLESQTIRRGNDRPIAFAVDPFRRHCLLNGLDDIGLTLEKADKIAAYEKKRAQATPWAASLIRK